MPSFSTEVPHTLGQSTAQGKLAKFVDQMIEQYQDQISHADGVWEGNILKYTLTTFGMKIDGKLTVTDNKVTADGNLPFAALILRGKIVEGVRDALEAALA